MNSDVEGIKSDEINGVFTGNIDADPLFIDKDNGNYMLTINSPCINTGTLDTVGLYLPTTDLGGNPRIYGGMIDMGTYEFQKNNFQILQQPVGITVCDRTTAHIETNVVGNVTGYNWQKNGIDLPLENQPVLTFSPISTSDSGYYNCLIFSFGKTLSTDTVKVSVILTASPSVANAEICEGDAVPSLVANGINIKWYNDAQLQNLVQTGSAYKPSVAQIGIYTYYVTQTSQSCESEPTTATLNIKSKPIPTLASSYSACKNINITLSAGTGFASYKWNTGATTESIYVTESGTYAVTITSTNGCSVSKSTEVTIYELPEIELGGPYYAVSGDSIILSAPDEMVSYIWNTGAVTPSITVKESGTYSVAIIDNNSCNNTDAAVVTISDIPVVDIGGPYEACEGKIIELDAGNGFSGYLWSTDETTQKIEVLETGVYTVTVTNSLGFSATDETQVTFLSMPDLQLPEDTAMLVTDTLTLDAGSGYQHYLWSTGSEDQIIKIYDLPVGTYLFSLQVIDKNGCNGYDTIRVLVIAGTYLMDPGSDLNFEIYPVPGKDIIYLKPGSNYDKDIVIRIMDITGRIMLETKIEKLFRSAAYPIDISSLSDGSYYLSISNKKIIKIERITKISGQ
jgi:hypothetical protein